MSTLNNKYDNVGLVLNVASLCNFLMKDSLRGIVFLTLDIKWSGEYTYMPFKSLKLCLLSVSH